MECQICKSAEANVHLTRIVGGEVQKATLCEGCAKEHGVQDPLSYSLLEPLLGLSENRKKNPPVARRERSCASCGMTESRFRSSGRLGCSECYRVFREALQQLLEAMHRGTTHTGKVPSRVQGPPPAFEFDVSAAPSVRPVPEADPMAQPPLVGAPQNFPTPPPVPPSSLPKMVAVQGADTFTLNSTQQATMGGKFSLAPSVDEIKKRMESAIQAEDYEEAAKLRDQLRKLGAEKAV